MGIGIAIGEVATAQQSDSHGGEVVGTDGADLGCGRLAGRRLRAILDHEHAFGPDASKRFEGDRAGGADATATPRCAKVGGSGTEHKPASKKKTRQPYSPAAVFDREGQFVLWVSD